MIDEKVAVKRPKRVLKPAEKKQIRTVASLSPQTQSLDGIQKLFQESWEIFTGMYASYVTLVLLGLGLFLVIGLIWLVLGLPLMISSGGVIPSTAISRSKMRRRWGTCSSIVNICQFATAFLSSKSAWIVLTRASLSARVLCSIHA